MDDWKPDSCSFDAPLTEEAGECRNCWEYCRCGRQPGGSQVDHDGICPAAQSAKHNGMNRGINGGRYCWRVAGTYCGGVVQGSFAQKLHNCSFCEFFGMVMEEEGDEYKP